ncbi:hypothetical protein [Herbaspirillum sp. Sphag1AN]|uniref:hypothetical protein n=1 Tax=Herbaspirillum sp. Sphag1AN TaxID=2587030 RepID=UPI001615448F|nr:hypothetical protein [Herbaspirillum sp. Sphag1AN]
MSVNINLVGSHVAAASRSLNVRPKQNASVSYKGRICTILSKLPLPPCLKDKLLKNFSQSKRTIPSELQVLENARTMLVSVVSSMLGDKEATVQMVDSLFCSVYFSRKNEFDHLNTELGYKTPSDYLRDIGQAAKEMGVLCGEKDDYLVPNGAGADIFTNIFISEILKTMPGQNGQPCDPTKYQRIAKNIAFNVVADLTGERTRVEAFSNKLAVLANKYAPGLNNFVRL